MVSKYDALGAYLQAQSGNEVPITFEEIERVTGAAFPPKSQHSRAWWSNNPSNSVLTQVWLQAGFESTQVDLHARKLVFKRKSAKAWTNSAGGHAGMADEAVEYKDADVEDKPTRHPAWGAMKGTFRIDPAWDITKPAYTDEEWAEVEKEMEEDWDQIEQGMSGGKK